MFLLVNISWAQYRPPKGTSGECHEELKAVKSDWTVTEQITYSWLKTISKLAIIMLLSSDDIKIDFFVVVTHTHSHNLQQ